jgi:arylsulfatase A-like enzyme
LPLPEIQLVAVVVVLAVAVMLRPERMAMALGVYLFAQSSIVRVPDIAPGLQEAFARLDEVVLLLLVARTVVARVVSRDFRLGGPLWAIAAFGAIGLVSSVMNSVPVEMSAVGIYLAVKPALWLFVALSFRYDRVVIARYLTLIGSLFAVAIVLAALQFAGLTLPWDTHVRRSGELAATSIWNQHTVFGSAMAVAIGLSVVAMRMPGWRRYGLLLAVGAAGGVVLSTVRRLLVSVPVALAVVYSTLSQAERTAVGAVARRIRAWPVALVIAVTVVGLGVVIGPRMVRVVGDTWDEYVVQAADRDRYALYRGGAELLVDSPVVGRGPGTFGSYASVLFESTAYDEVDVILPDSLKMGAPYASLLAEFGLAGTVAFLAFVALLAIRLRPIAAASDDLLAAGLASGGIFMLADMVIESVVHVTFSDSFVAYFAFTSAGAALALRKDVGVDRAEAPLSSPDPPRGRALYLPLGFSAALTGAMIVGVTLLSPSAGFGTDDRPNIVVVVVDDLSLDTLDALDGRTASGEGAPTIRELVGAAGVSFDNALATSPAQCAARVSVLTGLYPHNQALEASDEDDCHPAFERSGLEATAIGPWLHDGGYQTSFIGSYLPGYGRADFEVREADPPPGWDNWRAVWGPPAYRDYRLNENGLITGRGPTDEFYLTDVQALSAANTLRDGGRRPHFLLVMPFAPHDPPTRYPGSGRPAPDAPEAAPGDERLYADASPDLDLPEAGAGLPPFLRSLVDERRNDPALNDRLEREAIDDYRGRLNAMASIEGLVADILSTLAEEGELENTYVIFTSDSGYHLGERGLLPGGASLPYESDIRVPLLMRGPGIEPGSTSSELVSIVDLAATVADIAEVEPGLELDGRSLLGLATAGLQEEAWREAVIVESGDVAEVPAWVALRTDQAKYISWATGWIELYDVTTRPDWEDENLAPEAAASRLQALAAVLDAMTSCRGPTCQLTALPAEVR